MSRPKTVYVLYEHAPADSRQPWLVCEFAQTECGKSMINLVWFETEDGARAEAHKRMFP